MTSKETPSDFYQLFKSILLPLRLFGFFPFKLDKNQCLYFQPFSPWTVYSWVLLVIQIICYVGVLYFENIQLEMLGSTATSNVSNNLLGKIATMASFYIRISSILKVKSAVAHVKEYYKAMDVLMAQLNSVIIFKESGKFRQYFYTLSRRAIAYSSFVLITTVMFALPTIYGFGVSLYATPAAMQGAYGWLASRMNVSFIPILFFVSSLWIVFAFVNSMAAVYLMMLPQLYGFLLDAVADEVHVLSSKLNGEVALECDGENGILGICAAWEAVEGLVNNFCKLYGSDLLVIMVVSYIGSSVTIFNTFSNTSSIETPAVLLAVIVSSFGLRLVGLIHACAKVSEASQKMAGALVLLQAKFKERIDDKIAYMLLKLSTEQLVISPLDLFHINWNTLGAVISSTMSDLMILIQFQNSEGPKLMADD